MHPILTLAQTLHPLLWIGLSSLFFATSDILFRLWFQTYWSYGFAISFLIGVIGFLFLVMSFPSQNIAIATVIAILFNIIIYLIASYFLFGDTISMRQFLGLLIGISAIYILETSK